MVFIIMVIDQKLIEKLLEDALNSDRLRQNYDMRTSVADTSQRMLNALQVGTNVPIHRHEDTSETVICLHGRLEEIFYEPINESCTEFIETARFVLAPAEGIFGIQIPKGVWHSIHVVEPSVIFEAKDGAYIG